MESFETSRAKYGISTDCEKCATRQILKESLNQYFDSNYEPQINLTNLPLLWGIAFYFDWGIAFDFDSLVKVDTAKYPLKELGYGDLQHKSVYQKLSHANFVAKTEFTQKLKSTLPIWFKDCLNDGLMTCTRNKSILKDSAVVDVQSSKLGLTINNNPRYICLEATLQLMLGEDCVKPCEHLSREI